MIPATLLVAYGTSQTVLDNIKEHVRTNIIATLTELDPLAVVARRKSIESIYQKLQTGKYSSIRSLEDLIGVTVVLRTKEDTNKAMELVKQSNLQIIREHPPRPVAPTDFAYREPKLIVQPTVGYQSRHDEVDGISVEVQFTTALQHALDKTTHGFDYKGNEYEWERFRLVAQLRGILEMVDNLLTNIESSLTFTPPTDELPDNFILARSFASVLKGEFSDTDLPPDVRRLVDTVVEWCRTIEWDAPTLQTALRENQAICASRSISVADRILAIILNSRGDDLVKDYSGKLVFTNELATICNPTVEVPEEKIVRLNFN